MKDLTSIIINAINEAIRINKNTKLSNADVEDIIVHFDLYRMLEPYDNTEHKPILTKDELNEIRKKLEEFVKQYDIDKLEYYSCCMKYTKMDPKIAKDYKRARNKVDDIQWEFRHSKTNYPEQLFKKGGFEIEVNKDKGMIARYGPYGGAWFCKLILKNKNE